MRGIVVATVSSIIAWTFLTWCGVCACTWLEETSFSASALALTSSLAAIVCAAVMGAIWVGCLSVDGDVFDQIKLDLVADEFSPEDSLFSGVERTATRTMP